MSLLSPTQVLTEVEEEEGGEQGEHEDSGPGHLVTEKQELYTSQDT